MAELHVELVSVESQVWSGEASAVVARTSEGEVGVLPGHTPLLGELAPGSLVRILQAGGGEVRAVVAAGFLSVTPDAVSILAEQAELTDATDPEEALKRTSFQDVVEARRASAGVMAGDHHGA